MSHVCNKLIIISLFSTLMLSAYAADTVYITDQFKIGLHEDKDPDSPIVQIVATGTRLEIIKQEQESSFVREPQGASGWIDNTYLSQK